MFGDFNDSAGYQNPYSVGANNCSFVSCEVGDKSAILNFRIIKSVDEKDNKKYFFNYPSPRKDSNAVSEAAVKFASGQLVSFVKMWFNDDTKKAADFLNKVAVAVGKQMNVAEADRYKDENVKGYFKKVFTMLNNELFLKAAKPEGFLHLSYGKPYQKDDGKFASALKVIDAGTPSGYHFPFSKTAYEINFDDKHFATREAAMASRQSTSGNSESFSFDSTPAETNSNFEATSAFTDFNADDDIPF